MYEYGHPVINTTHQGEQCHKICGNFSSERFIAQLLFLSTFFFLSALLPTVNLTFHQTAPRFYVSGTICSNDSVHPLWETFISNFCSSSFPPFSSVKHKLRTQPDIICNQQHFEIFPARGVRKRKWSCLQQDQLVFRVQTKWINDEHWMKLICI